MKKIYLITFFILSALLFSCNHNASLTDNGNNTVNDDDVNDVENVAGNSWLDAPSLKETFVDGGYFDRFGLACEYDEISNSGIAEGLKYHANTTTPGNELKPQFVFWYPKPSKFTNLLLQMEKK